MDIKPRMKNIKGEKFGRWTVMEYSRQNPQKAAMWKCKCECDTVRDVRATVLITGRSKSCGCLGRENAAKVTTTHGHTRGNRCSRLYNIYSSMKGRCLNPNVTNYHRYGGRGIKVCEEWINSFESFCDWALANGYTDELTIDRINNDGNYEPGNCRWATRKEQVQNRRNTRRDVIEGESLVVDQISKKYSLKYPTVSTRFHRGDRGKRLIRPVWGKSV